MEEIMKNIISSRTRVSGALVMPLAGLVLLCTGCTRTPETGPDPGIAAAVALESDPTETALEYAMYVFRSPSGQGKFSLAEIISPLETNHRLDLEPDELQTGDYRFLFTAFPGPRAELAIHDTEGRRPAKSILWENIRVERLGGELSADYYYGITDLAGEAIIRTGKIAGTLTRLVGQPVYEFFRSEQENFAPDSIVSDAVASVFDRISGVQAEYTGTVTRMKFDAEGRLQPDAYADRTLMTSVTLDDNQQAHMPQEENGLTVAYADARGSVLLAGPYLLPSPESHRVRMTFTYYDDTPICGNSDGGNHTANCYAVKTVTLTMPAYETATLPVIADHQTVCRAGLPADRVIDCVNSANLNLETKWE